MIGTSLATLAAVAIGHLPACGGYLVRPSPAQGMADAARVARASHHDTGPRDLGDVMATPQWRIVWATPRDSEAGVFFVHGRAGAERFVDVWGGPTSDPRAAFKWAARKVGAPVAMARCFAAKLVAEGA